MGCLLTNRFENENDREDSNQLNIDFEHKFNEKGHQLTATFQTENNDETEISDIESFFENGMRSDDSEINTTLENQERSLVQVDYVYPINKDTQFEAGYRGTDNKRVIDYEVKIFDENNTATIDTNLSNTLDFEQEVHALYTQYGKKFNAFSFLLGLRFEKHWHISPSSWTLTHPSTIKPTMIFFQRSIWDGKSIQQQALR